MLLVCRSLKHSSLVQWQRLTLPSAVYYFRDRISEYVTLPTFPSLVPQVIYTRLPTSFADDIDSGLSSTTFDLGENVAEGDSRAGLDTKAKNAIRKIMKNRKVPFDEARRLFMQMRFREEGIGEDGLPKDPKFFSFS